MKTQSQNITCHIITEGLIGTENQCIGVANALNIPYETHRIGLNEPWKSLSPYIGLERKWSFSPELAPPWPDLLITSGRKSIAAARYIKAQSNGKTICVHIQDPRASYKTFDLIAVPQHDPARAKNIYVTKASPNKITADALNAVKDNFPDFAALTSPRIAVLIGGNSKAHTMTHDATLKLISDLNAIDGSLMVTCSRRTGAENTALLKNGLQNASTYFWDGTGTNPYLAFLAYADYILVTADSASMISESCTTGKPVYMLPLDGGAKRIDALHSNLIECGALKLFNGKLEPYTYTPLNDAQNVANEIKKRFGALLDFRDV